MTQQQDEIRENKKVRDEKAEAKRKEGEEKKKEEKEKEEEKKTHAICDKMQSVHDRRQEWYRIHFKKIRKYQKKHKDLLTRTPIYEQMESEFKEKIETPLLEEKKALLQSIRDMKKPINHKRMMYHCKSYTALRKKDIELKNLKMQKRIESRTKTYNTDRFKSKFQLVLQEQERRSKQEKNRESRLKDEMMAKRISYSKLVKETYKPVVSEKKRIEMEYLRRSLNNRGLPLNLR